MAAEEGSLEDMGAAEERPGVEPRAREGRSSPCRGRRGDFLLFSVLPNPVGRMPAASLGQCPGLLPPQEESLQSSWDKVVFLRHTPGPPGTGDTVQV